MIHSTADGIVYQMPTGHFTVHFANQVEAVEMPSLEAALAMLAGDTV